MNRLFFILLFALFISTLFGCYSSASEKTISIDSFFDLKEYFKNELVLLKEIKGVNKSVEINGHKEERNINNLDFSKELSPFIEADINRLAWKDKYKVDSILNMTGELSCLRYTAIEDKMRTQTLAISFQNNQVDSIFIQNKVSGFATRSDQEMLYVRENGYSIQSKQHTILGSDRSVLVQVKYLK